MSSDDSLNIDNLNNCNIEVTSSAFVDRYTTRLPPLDVSIK